MASTPADPRVDEYFGCDVFSLDTMCRHLPHDVYVELEKTVRNGSRLDPAIADTVANAMKDWAVSRGATHYTHWFQPLTGLTAEKHDAFLQPVDGRMISSFSGKTLLSGEPDASSFPSGGLRSTFEARGYTAWDPTSPVFLVGHTLHVPTMFYSYTGEALDRKVPLLRSVSAVSRQALRVLRLFGNTSARYVVAQAGPEQEYFLVDRELAARRPDLLLTGRTLYGAPTPKGQEMEDHYFAAIPERVMDFMEDLERHLYRLGIPAQTRHNEVAPAQFELAPLYEKVNIATDHNMLVMNLMRYLAPRHGFVCLLHEKPFDGVNGSGKHNNWSLADSDGNNLLKPGDTPQDNAQFLVFLAAVLRAVHKHAATLRLGTIGAGNDHRLGANEAPPAIISVYTGDQLADVIHSFTGDTCCASKGKPTLNIGVDVLPPLPCDYSDRNRTSPFAFTGNKFEFRAVGSSQSIAPANIAINAAVACALEEIADRLEAETAKGTPLNDAVQSLLTDLFTEHAPIIFNGNGYTEEWPVEAARRGLPNYRSTVDALQHYSDPDVLATFVSQGILTERECLSRQEILFENYAKSIAIEAATASRIGRTLIVPAVLKAQSEAAAALEHTRTALGSAPASLVEHVRALADGLDGLMQALDALDGVRAKLSGIAEAPAAAALARDEVLPAMNACRTFADSMESLVASSDWPLPSYAELMWTH
ncbi:glutamine synthetase III [uncultured Mailhella sp.]|uniref:glutamine synthetase III family protein n=1 Tax=uncultured Mailhella sp. TaxID=1981031 RepID=UPI00261569E7|nr:glutamine synthetase III [uncultured Mailhella sp.]